MEMSLSSLVDCLDRLKTARWRCEFQGERWKVSGVDLMVSRDLAELRCRISRDGREHRLALVERWRGRDRLRLDDAEYDADHEVSIRLRMLPLAVKVGLKSEYGGDDGSGPAGEIRLETKLQIEF